MKPKPSLESLILTLRGQKVLLDANLARLYGVETRALNQAVKRNRDRFPGEFAFNLTRDEILSISQSVTSLNSRRGNPASVGSLMIPDMPFR